MRWSDIQSCRYLNKQFAVARNCETFSYLVSYTVAVRWIEWPKVERDLVILCLVACMRYRGAAPQERSATGAKYQGILPPVCLRPAAQRQGLPVDDCALVAPRRWGADILSLRGRIQT